MTDKFHRSALLTSGLFLWFASFSGLCEQLLTNRIHQVFRVDEEFTLISVQRVLPARVPTQKQVDDLKDKNPRARFTQNYPRVEHHTQIAQASTKRTNTLLIVESIAFDYPTGVPDDYSILAAKRTQKDFFLVYRHSSSYGLIRFSNNALLNREAPVHYKNTFSTNFFFRTKYSMANYTNATLTVSADNGLTVRLDGRKEQPSESFVWRLDELIQH